MATQLTELPEPQETVTAWGEIVSRPIGQIQPLTVSSDYTPSLREDGEAKPSKAIETVVYEFGIRWPCPRDVDPLAYDWRLRDLARLCAGMAPGLLRKAGDRVAITPGRPFTLPSAAELHFAADQILHDRATAKQTAENAAMRSDAEQRGGGYRAPPSSTGERARQYNRENSAAGKRNRWTDAMEQFQIGDPGERRATRPDGSVIEPWFKADSLSWHPPQGDGPALAASYRDNSARYDVVRGEIVPVGA